MTLSTLISSRILQILLRVVAWASAVVLVAILFLALIVINPNALTSSLVEYVSARSGAEISYDRIALGWIDDSLVIQVGSPVIRTQSQKTRFLFGSDRIEVRISQPSADDGSWAVSKLEFVRPRVISHQSGAPQSDRHPAKADSDPIESIANGIGMLALVGNIHVVDGQYEFKIGPGDDGERFTGGFEVASSSSDGITKLSARMISNQIDESQLLLHLNSQRSSDKSGWTELEVVAKSVELARLLSVLPNNPVAARLDLSNLQTQIGAKVYVNLRDSELDSFNFSVEMSDPNLDGNIPDAKESKLTAIGELSLEDAVPGRVDVNLKLNSLDFAAVMRQHPAAFPPKFYKHISSRLRSLWLTDLNATLSADAKTMFKRDGDWDLQAKGRFSNFTYKFQERWPPVEGAQGVFAVDGARAVITGEKGVFHGQSVRHAGARIENFLIDDPIMTVTGGVDIPIAAAIDFFGEEGTVSPGTLGWIVGGKGASVVELGLNVPLRRGKEFALYGEIELANVDIATSQQVQVHNISGQMIFDRSGVTKGELSGQILGGPFAMQFSGSGTRGNFVVSGNSSGTADSSRLGEIIGESIVQEVLGDINWTADFSFAPQESEIDVSASLTDVVSTLPVPFRKGAGMAMPLRATVTTKNKTHRSIEASLGSQAAASIDSVLYNEKWQPTTGVISVGGLVPKRQSKNGVALYIDLPRFDYDAWSSVISRNSEGSSFGIADSLKAIALNADALILAGRRELHNARITADKGENQWDFAISTDTLAGSAAYKSSEFVHEGETPLLSVDLSVCHLPASEGSLSSKPTDPAELPALLFRCQDTKYGQYSLGRSTIEAEPASNSWKITHAEFSSPTFSMNVTGDWFHNQTSRLDLNLKSVDFGSTMNAFGYPEKFKRGNMDISGTLEWDAALTQWATHRTSGEIKIDSTDGVVLTDTGSELQKAIGVLNYETILQQLSSDVVDVLSEDGILYETMTGSVKLKNGEFHVDGIFLDGPSLTMALTGESSWNNKRHSLEAGVEPKLRKSFTTLAALLVNPVTGALVYAGGKLAEQVELNFKYHYDITGSWDKPEVKVRTN